MPKCFRGFETYPISPVGNSSISIQHLFLYANRIYGWIMDGHVYMFDDAHIIENLFDLKT